MLKYLIIGVLVALLFLLIYSRLRPYIELLRKVSSALKGGLDANSSAVPRGRSTKSENKLVRCVACGTWIPAERAIGAGSNMSEYCSRECLEKAATGEKRKLAG
ncbi:MAG: hypothetical protein ABR568_06475 [Pyrinomonadaceae bacterium]